jgi:hypothetical protein
LARSGGKTESISPDWSVKRSPLTAKRREAPNWFGAAVGVVCDTVSVYSSTFSAGSSNWMKVT